jgi:transcriptional regulator with XRE-family HTH domain
MDGVPERFGSNLARCRKEAGLTQRTVAARAGLHRTQISLLENGKRTPRIDTLIKLASALSVRPEVLMEGICGGRTAKPKDEPERRS